MKKNILLAVAVISLLTLASGFLITNKGVQAVTVKVNIHDIPEHGISLISPSDPSFETKVASLLGSNPNQIVDTMKPFSVFIRNMGDKTIVAYQLRWELMKADGTIVTRESGGSNPRALMDGGVPGLEHLSTNGGYAIKPNDSRFISLGFSLAGGQGGEIGAYAGGTDQKTIARLEKAAKSKNLSGIADEVSNELRTYTSITVSVEGVFFEDGTFVGADKTGFFAQFKASIDAKQDLLKEVRTALKENQDRAEIFKKLEGIANSQEVRLDANSTASDHYSYFKKIYAGELLSMKRAMGEDRTIARVHEQLRKPWPELRKKP